MAWRRSLAVLLLLLLLSYYLFSFYCKAFLDKNGAIVADDCVWQLRSRFLVDEALRPASHPRLVVIGDIHGCAEELQEVINKTGFLPVRDRLVLIGDLIGKGPLSKETLDIAIRYKAECIRGNHDHTFITWHQAKPPNRPKLKSDYLKIANSFSAEHWQYLLSCKMYDVKEEYNLILVHAGLEPQKVLEEQNPKMLMNMRNIEPDGSGSAGQGGIPWISSWNRTELVIFGHDAYRGLQCKFDENKELKALGLDSGVVYGNYLSAFVLPDYQLVQVPAHRVYEVPKL